MELPRIELLLCTTGSQCSILKKIKTTEIPEKYYFLHFQIRKWVQRGEAICIWSNPKDFIQGFIRGLFDSRSSSSQDTPCLYPPLAALGGPSRDLSLFSPSSPRGSFAKGLIGKAAES